VRALLGCQTPTLIGEGPWSMPVAGGKRTVIMQRADIDGQLHLDTNPTHA